MEHAHPRLDRARDPGRGARLVADVRRAGGPAGGGRRRRRRRVRRRRAPRRQLADVRPGGGAARRRRSGRGAREAIVATKIWTGDVDDGAAAVRRPARLVRRAVDLLQVHNLVAWRAHLDVDGARARGRADRLARARRTTQPSAFGELEAVMRPGRIDAVQVPLNPVERTRERADPAARRGPRAGRDRDAAARRGRPARAGRSRPSSRPPASAAGPRRSSAGASPTRASPSRSRRRPRPRTRRPTPPPARRRRWTRTCGSGSAASPARAAERTGTARRRLSWRRGSVRVLRIVEGGREASFVYRDDRAVAFLDIGPVTPRPPMVCRCATCRSSRTSRTTSARTCSSWRPGSPRRSADRACPAKASTCSSPTARRRSRRSSTRTSTCSPAGRRRLHDRQPGLVAPRPTRAELDANAEAIRAALR